MTLRSELDSEERVEFEGHGSAMLGMQNNDDGVVFHALTGLYLLALVWGLAGLAIPTALHLLVLIPWATPNDWFGVIYIQMILLPSCIAAAIAMSVPMLIDRSALSRCGLCLLVFAPGVIGLWVGFHFLDDISLQFDSLIFLVVVSAAPVFACVACVLRQMLSGKAIRNTREMPDFRMPLGIRSLMELTLVVGCLLGILAFLDDDRYWKSTLAVGSVGAMIAVLCTGASKMLLCDRIADRAVFVSVFLCWLGSILCILLMKPESFTFGVTGLGLLSTISLPLLGTVSCSSMLWMCIGILRKSGWRYDGAN